MNKRLYLEIQNIYGCVYQDVKIKLHAGAPIVYCFNSENCYALRSTESQFISHARSAMPKKIMH